MASVCPVCEGPMPKSYPNRRYCSKRCRKRANRKRERERARQRGGRTTPRLYEGTCLECSSPFIARRANARYCGESCRKRAEYRRWSTKPEVQARKRARAAQRRKRLREDAYYRHLSLDPCAYCGGPGGTVDHVVPLYHGGEDTWENMAGACHDCNTRKGTKPLLRFMLVRLVDQELAPLMREREAILAVRPCALAERIPAP